MSEINVSLSDLSSGEEHYGVFHDYTYKSDGTGGNGAQTSFEFMNQSGNELFVEMCVLEQDTNGKWSRNWYPAAGGQGLDGLRVHFNGSIERSEFLQMLKLILNTEKMTDIIKP